MSVTVNDSNSGIVTIKIADRFTFNIHREFRDAYKDRQAGIKYEIDLRETNYMDSSALGMLLLLKEFNASGDQDIKILHCQPDIKRIFEVTNFHQLFQLVD